MIGDDVIIRAPRALQVVILLQFPDDTRSDEKLRAYVLDSVNVALGLGGHMKAIAVQPVPFVSLPGAVPQ